MQNYETLTHEYRGDVLDLIHHGYITVVDKDSNLIASVGDPLVPMFFRSSSKPLQALPVIMRGLDEKYGLSEEETVIFSGSHLAEPFHVDALNSIFNKAGLNPDDLTMKPTVPGSVYANELRIKNGVAPQKIFHNCSGKHSALMMLQKELNGSVLGYHKIESPCQQEILSTLATMSEFPKEEIKIALDGCGVPVFCVPMKHIAIAYKNLAVPESIKDESLKQACLKYVPRIHKYPLMMRGTDYLCSVINYDENIVAKGGANGVYGLALKKEGIGISFKINDGSEAMWPIILKEIFKQIGYKNEDTMKRLTKLHTGELRNDNQTVVGHCEAVFNLK